jgi:hypothetical protein
MYFYFTAYLTVLLQLRLHDFDLLDLYFVRAYVGVLFKDLEKRCENNIPHNTLSIVYCKKKMHWFILHCINYRFYNSNYLAKDFFYPIYRRGLKWW